MSGAAAVIRQALQRDVRQEVVTLARAIADRHYGVSQAVLFYGSCARTGSLDGLLDFYLLVDDYAGGYRSRLPAVANRLLPPNVYYYQHETAGLVLRAKYAVVSLRQLRRLVTPDVLQSYFWARFAQPMRLVWLRDPTVEPALVDAMVTAATTMFHCAPGDGSPLERWQAALALTYGAELRPEPPGACANLVAADRSYFATLGTALAAPGLVPVPGGTARRWMVRRWWGKTLNVVRVLKAYWTFDGGVDYLFWKIARHSGVEVEVTDAMRRHPWRRALPKLWRLYRQGAFR